MWFSSWVFTGEVPWNFEMKVTAFQSLHTGEHSNNTRNSRSAEAGGSKSTGTDRKNPKFLILLQHKKNNPKGHRPVADSSRKPVLPYWWYTSLLKKSKQCCATCSSQQRLASVAMSAQPTDRQQEPVGTVEHTSWAGGCTADSPLPSYPHPSLKKEKVTAGIKTSRGRRIS